MSKTTLKKYKTKLGQISLPDLYKKRDQGEKVVMLTCYDSSFASLMDSCGVDILWVDASLGEPAQGGPAVDPVTLDDMFYHTKCVAKGACNAMVVVEMPVGTYSSPIEAFINSGQLMAAGAHCVSLIGGSDLVGIVKFLTEQSVPVCVQLGKSSQASSRTDDYVLDGKSFKSAARMKRAAVLLQNAGAKMILLKAIPAFFGKEISGSLHIPTIGMGAGPDCSGQFLFMHDMLDIWLSTKPRFVKNFMEEASSIREAISSYVRAVRQERFPAPEHCF